VAQAMISHSGDHSGGLSLGSGGSGDDDDPRKWKPWDSTQKLLLFPRNKKAGGKHFIPAGWIDRLFAVAYVQAGTLGRALEFIEDIRDLLGEETPLEISSFRVQEDEKSAYVSLTDSRRIGYDQIIHTYRERLREWAQNIYLNALDSSGDDSGKQIDMPESPSNGVARRLRNAALALVSLFDKWIGRHGPTVQFPFSGTVYVRDEKTSFSVPKQVSGVNVEISWLVIRAKIMEMLDDL
jgi:hypothetical protein